MRRLTIVICVFGLGCNRGPVPEPPDAAADPGVPRWAQEAIWYQVFVERFRNGDPSNDPTLIDTEGAWPHVRSEAWAVTPWGHDWYAEEAWARATGEPFYVTVHARRYGGDFQGVLDQLDHLQQLGVTALYFNPLNDAPSLHKYDARSYHHMDRNFGPDPEGDRARMEAEDPADPATWSFTSADSLFFVLVDEIHRRGMRVVIDVSWNHTGSTFWAWRDVVARQADSPYAGWYEIARFDDPATPDTSEFAYRGWAGVPELPELKKVGRPEGRTHGAIEGTLAPPVREHVFAVTRRWLDPNGDGDPSDGVDGFRLDVAEMVPLGFWRDYRRFVRGINPDAYLVGEVWWESWPDRMYDPAPWLQGDVFDAVMNYRWYAATRRFFAGAPPALTASAYLAALESADTALASGNRKAMMNLTSSHDAPRFSTSIYNPGLFKYHANPREDADYRVDRPDARTREIQQLILVQQFTGVGAPHVWNGDELGMWGADDPDDRKPLVWPDLRYDDEVAHPFGRPRRRDPVAPDLELTAVYRALIALRRENLELFVDGSLRGLLAHDERGLVAYERARGDRRAIVAFNASEARAVLELDLAAGTYVQAFPAGAPHTVVGGEVSLEVPARSAVVLLRRGP